MANWNSVEQFIVHDELPVAIRSHLDQLSAAMHGRWQIIAPPKRGFSSSVIYPIQIAGERYALRNWNWPISAADELAAKLQFQQRLARGWSAGSLLSSDASSDCPVAVVLDSWANGRLVAEAGDVLWTLSSWRDGESIGWQGTMSQPQFESVAQTLAKMHGISLAYHSAMMVSAGWQDRLDRLRNVAQADLPPAASIVADVAARSDSVIRTLRNNGYFSQSVQWVHTQAMRSLPNCWIIRDAHQENWIFSDETVSGIVDFGAARCDWLGWDLIRLLSSARCVSAQRIDFIDTYLNSLRDCAPRQVAVVSQSIELLMNEEFWRDLDFLQNLLSAMQWRAWSLQERQWSRTELDRWNMLLERLG